MSALSNVASLAGWKGYAAAALAGVVVLAAAGAWVRWYGVSQFEAGALAKKTEIEKRQAAIERAWQEERDRADAKYRGAIVARQAVESQNTELRQDVASAHARIAGLGGLLEQYRTRAEAARSSGRPDAPGADWVGILGECVGRVESLSRRLDQVGKDAARWADQVSGLQGYVRAAQIKEIPEETNR